MEADPEASPPTDDSLLVLRSGENTTVPLAQEVELEDGGVIPVENHLPATLPAGYHHIHLRDGRRVRLIVSPGKCWLPRRLRTWGWAVQIYAARSAKSWGLA
jgi:4-alpha-glucanotransferase